MLDAGNEGCSIAAFDPAAMKRTQEELPATAKLTYVADAYAAAVDADAVLILTDWSEFANLDLKRLYTIMRYPIIIDGRNLFEPRVMHDHGFTYISIGRPAINPVHADIVSPTIA